MGPLDFIKDGLGAAEGIIDKFVDDAQEKAEAKALLQEQKVKLMEQATIAETERAKTVRAEIRGSSWFQRNWRPLVALGLFFIPFNNYVLVPYAQAFGAPIPTVQMPGWVGAALTTMIGGYTVGRSYEKVKGVASNDVPSITDKVLQRIGDATK